MYKNLRRALARALPAFSLSVSSALPVAGRAQPSTPPLKVAFV
jgi:hypothetical protein